MLGAGSVSCLFVYFMAVLCIQDANYESTRNDTKYDKANIQAHE